MDLSTTEILALRVAVKRGYLDLMLEHGYQEWTPLIETPSLIDLTIRAYLLRTIQEWEWIPELTPELPPIVVLGED